MAELACSTAVVRVARVCTVACSDQVRQKGRLGIAFSGGGGVAPDSPRLIYKEVGEVGCLTVEGRRSNMSTCSIEYV